MALQRLCESTEEELTQQLAGIDGPSRQRLGNALSFVLRLMGISEDQTLAQWALMSPRALIEHVGSQSTPFLYRTLEQIGTTRSMDIIFRRATMFSLYKKLVREGHYYQKGFVYGRRRRVVQQIIDSKLVEDLDGRLADNLSRYVDNGQSYSTWVDELGGYGEGLLALPCDISEFHFATRVQREKELLMFLLRLGVKEQANSLHHTDANTSTAIAECVEMQRRLRTFLPPPSEIGVEEPLSADILLSVQGAAVVTIMQSIPGEIDARPVKR